MIPYFHRYRCKMFIREKPIRFGYKIWSLCGTDDNPYHLNIYTGRDGDASTEPLGSRLMKKMVNIITTQSETVRHTVLLDYFFTSYSMIY